MLVGMVTVASAYHDTLIALNTVARFYLPTLELPCQEERIKYNPSILV